MKTLGKNLLWVVAVAVGVYVGMSAVGMSQQQAKGPLPISPIKSPTELSLAFRDVADRVLPAVVTIRSETGAKEVAVNRGNGGNLPSPFGGGSQLEEEFLQQFFGRNFDMDDLREQMENQRRYSPPSTGSGSGFIVESSGVILTNSHVVEGADRVYVTLQDGREIKASSWNYDPRSDIAIVRIEAAEALPSLVLGDSDLMQVGDWVVAAGNPLGIGTSVTAGIISATGRSTVNINERENFLQTDAAINPGNSGGPLINLHGEVIGINTAISTRSGGYDGVGFAIPSNMARWVADQLIQNGTVKRAYLGVALQMLSNDLRDQLGIPNGQGTLVSNVGKDSPAAKAGVQVGDVILEFNRESVGNSEQLVDLVERSNPGNTYSMKVMRDGKAVSLDVIVQAMPSDYTPALARSSSNGKSAESAKEEKAYDKLGLKLTELTDEYRNQLSYEKDVEGLLVLQVEPNSAAANAGIERGDVIERVGQKPVKDLDGFANAVKGLDPEKGILLYVRSQAGARFVVVKIEK